MLTSIRTTFSKGLPRFILSALMVLLIASFGFWGIADVFRGFHSTDVATVGSTSISAQQFQQAFTQQIQDTSRRIGTTLTPDQARALGLDRQVLGRMATDAALDEQTRQLRLNLSPQDTALVLRDDPQFQGAAGGFDRLAVAEYMRESGLSEAGFLALRRGLYTRSELGQALAGRQTAPQALIEAQLQYAGETRNISYVTLTDADAGDVGSPDQATLAKYFDEHRSDFRAPEMRGVTYLAVTPAALAAGIAVSDADLHAAYDSQKAALTVPEKRHVERIVFAKPEEAAAAAARLASGTSFDTIVKERGLKPADVDIGTLAKADIPDPVLAGSAFSLKAGATSGVLTTPLASVIVKVDSIEPETVPTFEAARDGLRQAIATDRGRQAMLDLEGKIEEARDSGATLKEVADRFKLKAETIVAMDHLGQDAAGQPYTLPVKDQLLQAVFSTDPGTDTQVIDGRDEGLVWYEVSGITPARDRTLAEATAPATDAWRAEERARRLQARADALLAKLRGGTAIDALATDEHLDVKQAWTLKRSDTGQGLSAPAVAAVFNTAKGASATALSGEGTDRLVFTVTDRTLPDFDAKSPEATALATRLGSTLGQEMLTEYVKQLQSDLGLSVNEDVLAQAVGGGQS